MLVIDFLPAISDPYDGLAVCEIQTVLAHTLTMKITKLFIPNILLGISFLLMGVQSYAATSTADAVFINSKIYAGDVKNPCIYTFTVGYQADFLLLNQDIFEVDRDHIHKTVPTAVVVNGRIVSGAIRTTLSH